MKADRIIEVIKYCFTAVLIIAAVSACVTAEDEAFYNSSLVMAQQGQKEKAYQNIQGLCVKFPEDKRFCAEAASMKRELYNENMDFVRLNLDSKGPLPKAVLNAAEQKLGKATIYSDDSSEITRYSSKLADQKNATQAAVTAAKNEAVASEAKGDLFGAYNAALGAKELDPAVLGPIVDSYGKRAVETGMADAEKLLAQDSLKEVKDLLNKMKAIDPANEKIQQYLALAEKNDNPEYYISKGKEVRDGGELERSVTYFMRALAFPDARQEAQQLIDETRVQMVEVSFVKGTEFASQELNKQAYDNFMKAFEIMKDLPLEMRTMVNIPKDELEQYYDNMYFLGQKAMDSGAIGQSYLYFKMLYDLVPSYHGLRTVKKDVEDKVLSRALKSIAVIPFKSPVNEPELGLQVTSNIMQILQKSLNNDVKIIERGALEILLREYELAVAGNANSSQSSPDSFRIKSADYLLMGEVLDSRTETNVQNSKKKVRVKIGENKERNIEWEDWAREYEPLRKAGKTVPPEPIKYVMKPVYDYAEYDVSFHEKVSYLSISYRVVETSQGRVTYSNTVRAQKEAKDEATSGIDLGSYKVDMKAANLPTDIELSNLVRKETIDKISSQVMDLFKDQDEKYLDQAQKLEASNNVQEAVEMYVNAILMKMKKGMDVSQLEDKAGKYLDVLSAY